MDRMIAVATNDQEVASSELKLAKLRADLDYVDSRLLEIVRARIEVIEQIAVLKQHYDIPMMQPGRMRVVHERAQRFADEHRLSPEFLRSLYDLLIGEACRVEDEIIYADAGQTPDHAVEKQR